MDENFKHLRNLSILLGFSIITLLSCKKVQPDMNTIDCSCAKEVSADFTMKEIGSLPSLEQYFTETDTILKNKSVLFTALDESAEYTWYIGNEILHTKSVKRYFNDTWAGQDIPITLVIKKKPNRVCFPNDDGYDSVTKILHVSQYLEITSNDYNFGTIEGKYRFKSAHLQDSFDVVFFISKNEILYPGNALVNFENYDGLGNNCYDLPHGEANNFRQSFFVNGGGCSQIEGNIHNKLNGDTEMNFTLYYPNHPNYSHYQYKGRRISNL
jgi:hypothetical protein